MLATQFLNVVLQEENDSKRSDEESEEMECETKEEKDQPSNDEGESQVLLEQIISQLDIKAALAKILMEECVIEPVELALKREKKVLSFEANVTPIYGTPPKKRKYTDEVDLLEAVEAVYSDGEENYMDSGQNLILNCPICNRVFSRNCSLALHMKSHEAAGDEFSRYQCHFCTQSFMHKALLKSHLSECLASRGWSESPVDIGLPSDGSGRRYECQYCHRTYTQKSVLKKHLVVHTGERERCEICGAGFSQRSSLVRHAKRIHGQQYLPLPNNPPAVNNSIHNTPILTTALSGVTHPRFGTPLIVGIPLHQLEGGKYHGTQFQRALSSQLSGKVMPGNIPLASLLRLENPIKTSSMGQGSYTPNVTVQQKPIPVGPGATLVKLPPGAIGSMPAVLKLAQGSSANAFGTSGATVVKVASGGAIVEKILTPVNPPPLATIVKVASGGAVIEKISLSSSKVATTERKTTSKNATIEKILASNTLNDKSFVLSSKENLSSLVPSKSARGSADSAIESNSSVRITKNIIASDGSVKISNASDKANLKNSVEDSDESSVLDETQKDSDDEKAASGVPVKDSGKPEDADEEKSVVISNTPVKEVKKPVAQVDVPKKDCDETVEVDKKDSPVDVAEEISDALDSPAEAAAKDSDVPVESIVSDSPRNGVINADNNSDGLPVEPVPVNSKDPPTNDPTEKSLNGDIQVVSTGVIDSSDTVTPSIPRIDPENSKQDGSLEDVSAAETSS